MTYRVVARDKVAHALANLALRVGTAEYRAYIAALMRLGERELADSIGSCSTCGRTKCATPHIWD